MTVPFCYISTAVTRCFNHNQSANLTFVNFWVVSLTFMTKLEKGQQLGKEDNVLGFC